jgi:predicted  nucleic acid-binding Zn-ribbon protein
MRKNGWRFSVLLVAAISVLAGGIAWGADMNAPNEGGHNASMPNEDPSVFIKNIDKAVQDVMNQVKAGRTMDAQKSVSQLADGVEKLLPHVTDAVLKDRLENASNEIKNSVNSAQPDIFDLEDMAQELQDVTKQVAEQLKNMK